MQPCLLYIVFGLTYKPLRWHCYAETCWNIMYRTYTVLYTQWKYRFGWYLYTRPQEDSILTVILIHIYYTYYLSIYLRSYDSCRRLPDPKHHSFLFNHWSASKCLVFMAVRTPSIHVFLGRPLFLLSPGIHSIINFGSLSSCSYLLRSY
jgi:hypothetical protein